MEHLGWIDFVLWVPLIMWVGLFFWFYRRAYPIFLKEMVKKKKKWAYVPEFVSKRPWKVWFLRFLCFVFSLIVIVLSVFSVVWILIKFLPGFQLLGYELLCVATMCFFWVLAKILYYFAMRKVESLFQSAYFLEYRRVRYVSDVRGNFQNETDIHNKTFWSFTKRLRNAEEHRRLWKYLNAMAKTKKIPPDVYAETMYG